MHHLSFLCMCFSTPYTCLARWFVYVLEIDWQPRVRLPDRFDWLPATSCVLIGWRAHFVARTFRQNSFGSNLKNRSRDQKVFVRRSAVGAREHAHKEFYRQNLVARMSRNTALGIYSAYFSNILCILYNSNIFVWKVKSNTLIFVKQIT